MKPICAPLVRVLNGLVVELVFPEEVHACLRRGFGRQGAGLRLFDSVAQAILPVLPPNMEQTILSAQAQGKSKTDTDRIVCATLRQLYETLHDGAHPLRLALEKLSTLETVRIIEGRAR